MGAFQTKVQSLTSDPGARWLAGMTDELAATLKVVQEKVAALDETVKGLQQRIADCCDDDSPGLRVKFAELVTKHETLAGAHKALEAKHAELTERVSKPEAKQ